MENSTLVKTFIEINQKELFRLAYISGYDIYFFIKQYMRSDICKSIDSGYSYWQTQAPETILEALILELKSNRKVLIKANEKNADINIDAIEWLGFFYRKWHNLTNERSSIIVRFLSPEDGIRNWYTYHQLDEKDVIEMAKSKYNVKRNNHRRNEINNSEENESFNRYFKSGDGLDIYSNPDYYCFLAKQILLKLYRYPLYEKLEFNKLSDLYDFKTPNNELGLECKTFRSSNLIRFFKITNKEAMSLKPNCDTSILFIFVFSEKYELDQEAFFSEIYEIVNTVKPINRKYDYVYFYLLGQLVEINRKNEITKYWMPFSKKKE